MNRLRDVRQAMGMTQEQLEIASGVSQSAISQVERLGRSMTGQNLAAVAEALEISTDYLLGLTDDPRPARTDAEVTLAEWAILRALRDGDIERAAALVRGEAPDVD